MNPIVAVLAVWRLTKLVVEDEVSRPAREKVVAWSEQHDQGSWQDRTGYLVDCRACVSVWAALAVGALSWSRSGRAVVKTLAGSGAALVLAGLIDKLESE